MHACMHGKASYMTVFMVWTLPYLPKIIALEQPQWISSVTCVVELFECGWSTPCYYLYNISHRNTLGHSCRTRCDTEWALNTSVRDSSFSGYGGWWHSLVWFLDWNQWWDSPILFLLIQIDLKSVNRANQRILFKFGKKGHLRRSWLPCFSKGRNVK